MRVYTRTILAGLLGLCLLWSSGAGAAESFAELPVQHNGRVKPLRAFAYELLQKVSGKSRWQGQSAEGFLSAYLDSPGGLRSIAFIRVDHPDLKKMMNLSAERHYFSLEELGRGENSLVVALREAAQSRERDERPTLLQQKVENLYDRMMTVGQLSSGDLLRVIPSGVDQEWKSYAAATEQERESFLTMIRICREQPKACREQLRGWNERVTGKAGPQTLHSVRQESLYYQLHPFYYAAWLYFLGFVLLLSGRPLSVKAGGAVLAAGFLLHAAGLVLRGLILERPPVANMYETMIFMDAVLMLALGVLVIVQKRRAFLSCGALVSGLVMLYANLLPVDRSLDVLTPVLRSNYWLTIHVITITSSYSLFALANAVAHRHLFLAVRGNWPGQETQMSAHTMERLLQAGLVTLGAGTILGGVWANDAWGRFWGWDPKETWAFITFLGYMAIVHLRLKNKLSDFALAVGSIAGFLLVLMTWYGVNFVLGRGMHSYGSGSGGVQWMVYFLLAEAVYLVYVWWRQDRTKP